MRVLSLFALLPLAACAAATSRPAEAPATTWITHGTLLAGAREFDDSTVKALDLESHVGYGVEFDGYDADTGSGWEAGYQQSGEDNSFGAVSVELELQEVYVGFRQTFMPERNLHPYIGAGASYLRGTQRVSGLGSDDDTDLGPYIHGGMLWDVGQRIRLGLDYRMVFAGFDGIDGDYQQLAASLGFRF